MPRTPQFTVRTKVTPVHDNRPFQGVQYLLKRSFATQLIWLFLVILALAGATIFAKNIFTDWKGERTITSLKTISKPVTEVDFPSVTICKDGLNLQAVREALERDEEEWEAKRIKRAVTLKPDFCQTNFERPCEQVGFFLSNKK